MAIKKIGQIKQSRWFRVWDLIVYGAVAVIIAALFLAVFLTRDKSAPDGFKISCDGREVFVYSFAEDKYESLSPSKIGVEEENGEKLVFTVYTDDGNGYNKIEVNKVKKTVRVIDANCSAHKDCVYTPAITGGSSAIVCPPHGMIITPLGTAKDDDGNIIIG